MQIKEDLILSIKDIVRSVDPGATVILYGSYARGDYNEYSDIDLLILVDKKKITPKESKEFKYPLYELEFETGQIISPFVITRNDWETLHKPTPFYDNIIKEGIAL